MRNKQPGQKKRKHKFIRHHWFRYKKLGMKWRFPKGRTSKMRLACKSRPPTPNAGYGSPPDVKGLLNGMKPVLVYNMADLDNVDAKANQGVVLSAAIGKRKAIAIAAEAEKKGMKILNHRKVSSAKHFMYMKEKQKEEKKVAAAKKKEESKAKDDAKKAEEAKSKEAHSPEGASPKSPKTETPKEAPKEAASPKSADKKS